MNVDAVELLLAMLACFLAGRVMATHDPRARPHPRARLLFAQVALALAALYIGLKLSSPAMWHTDGGALAAESAAR